MEKLWWQKKMCHTAQSYEQSVSSTSVDVYKCAAPQAVGEKRVRSFAVAEVKSANIDWHLVNHCNETVMQVIIPKTDAKKSMSKAFMQCLTISMCWTPFYTFHLKACNQLNCRKVPWVVIIRTNLNPKKSKPCASLSNDKNFMCPQQSQKYNRLKQKCKFEGATAAASAGPELLAVNLSLQSLFWSSPPPDGNVLLFICWMLRNIYKLVANFVCCLGR